MFIKELYEGLSSKLFHFTDLQKAASILEDGYFKLSSVVGSSYEDQINPKEYPYFLSTTRTKFGGYHDPYSEGVMFNLNGDYYKQHYKGMPIDYWGDRGMNIPGRRHEAEDRIVSKNPNIPIDGITEMHIFISDDKTKSRNYIPSYTRKVLFLAKKHNIPTYLYNDKSAWFNQQKNKAIPINAHPSLKGHMQPRRSYRKSDQVKPWLELIIKNSRISLSDRAEKNLKNLLYYYTKGSSMGADTDFSNARKPNSDGYESLTKIINFMQQNNLKTVPELMAYLKNKWDKLK